MRDSKQAGSPALRGHSSVFCGVFGTLSVSGIDLLSAAILALITTGVFGPCKAITTMVVLTSFEEFFRQRDSYHPGHSGRHC
jgi:hypothetical protein